MTDNAHMGPLNACTEEEAKHLWCPMAKTRLLLAGGGTAPEKGALCFASRCMWWRWADGERGYCGGAAR